MVSQTSISDGVIYHKLAPLYDRIMRDVDYEDWTEYVDSIIQYHHPGAITLLELACGTGTMALMLEHCDHYKITGTDASESMIAQARIKAARNKSGIRWLVQDMRRLDIDERFDVVYMVFDSLNYLHDEREVDALLKSVAQHLADGGIFLFDFTTPSHSTKILPYLNNTRNITPRHLMKRSSSYDAEQRLHYNHFSIIKKDRTGGKIQETFRETHIQKTWSFSEIKERIEESPLRLLTAYEDFELDSATEDSDRITMVVTHG